MNKTLQQIIMGLVATLATLAVKELVDFGVEQQDVPFLMFPAAILISAWFGGYVAGISALAASSLTVLVYYLPFQRMLESSDYRPLWHLLVFLLEGSLACTIVGKLQRSRSSANRFYKQASDAHEKLNAWQSTFRTLIDSNIIGFMMARLDGTVIDANDAFLELVGCDLDHVRQGKLNWQAITIPEHHERDQLAVQELKKSGRTTLYEKIIHNSDGEQKHLLMGAALSETPEEMIAFILDNTESHRIRTELEDAVKTALAASQAKNDFLANVSHELRTPLNGIIGMTELAIDETQSATVEDYLLTSLESAESLLSLINQVLDFSKIESGVFELHPEPFHLHELIDQTVKTLSHRAHERGLELIEHIDRDVPKYIVGDKSRLRQVLVNLIANAIKFTESGEIFVKVSSTPMDDPCLAGIVIHVRDTGVGISPEDQKVIFEPFSQADSSYTRQYGGTGLGLAICQEIIHRMDGRIELTSTPGCGSEFSVFLTLKLDDLINTGKSSLHLHNFDTQRILIVDDNNTQLQVTEEMLCNWGAEVETATSARVALEKLRESEKAGKRYSVMLIDALMPEMNGFELLKQAEQDQIAPEHCVMMISSTDRHLYEDEVNQANLAALLPKPTSRSSLFDALVTCIHGQESLQVPSPPRIVKNKDLSLKILVAEDTQANQKVIEQILKRRGHIIDLTSNGREAVNRILTNHYDVVLMDLQMPTMDGFQAIEFIRKLEDPHHAKIPIIAVTAHALNSDRERAMKTGANDYLTKPLNAAELLDRVEKLANSSLSERTPQTKEKQMDNHSMNLTTQGSLFDDALKRMGGNQELLIDLGKMYQEDYQQRFEEIIRHLQGEKQQELKLALHSIKGLVGNFGLNWPAYQTIVRWEEYCTVSNFESIQNESQIFELQLMQLDRALDQFAEQQAG
ncbi:MAG: response regulator [Planctomycetaceae bacterium]|nr:response regulator [Planctomycetaceae bacterium]